YTRDGGKFVFGQVGEEADRRKPQRLHFPRLHIGSYLRDLAPRRLRRAALSSPGPRQSTSGSRASRLGSYHAQYRGTGEVQDHCTPWEPGGAVVVGAGRGNAE